MGGYIAIANENWCDYLQSSNASFAVFWRKKNVFKALKKGECFFFLNRRIVDGKRYVIGRGRFDEWNVLPTKKAWAIYGCALGFQEEQEFLKSVKSIYRTDEVELGCILLTEVVCCNQPVCLSDCDIDFSPYIVSGKIINEDECIRLNSALERRT